jgi:hypothetical protein
MSRLSCNVKHAEGFMSAWIFSDIPDQTAAPGGTSK